MARDRANTHSVSKRACVQIPSTDHTVTVWMWERLPGATVLGGDRQADLCSDKPASTAGDQ